MGVVKHSKSLLVLNSPEKKIIIFFLKKFFEKKSSLIWERFWKWNIFEYLLNWFKELRIMWYKKKISSIGGIFFSMSFVSRIFNSSSWLPKIIHYKRSVMESIRCRQECCDVVKRVPVGWWRTHLDCPMGDGSGGGGVTVDPGDVSWWGRGRTRRRARRKPFEGFS